MSGPNRIIPKYRYHKRSGKAIVTVYTADGARRDILLPGKFESKESKAEYGRLLARLRANEGALPKEEERKPDLSIAELVLRFMKERVYPYYVNPITKEPTGEDWNFECAMTPLTRLFADLPVGDFGPQTLVKVRSAMIDLSWMNDEEKKKHQAAGRKPCLARTTVNTRIGRIKMMFKWGVTMEIVSESIYNALWAVPGLARGRSDARETEDVPAVPVEIFESTLPHLPPIVRDIVELLLLSGMRVGEAVVMRPVDIDMTSSVWVYKPANHKTAWRGHKKAVTLGPRAQDIIRRHLKPKVDAYLFSPMEQRDLIDAEKRRSRQTKVQPSQECRKIAKPKKLPGECFTPDGINGAIERACERHGIPKWHTHQIRHTAAQEVTRQYGEEAARAVLGQKQIKVTRGYIGIDQKTAAGVMGKIG